MIDDLFDQLKGEAMFRMIDPRFVYHQVHIKEKDIHKHECGISWNTSNKTKLGLPKAKPPQPSTINSTS